MKDILVIGKSKTNNKELNVSLDFVNNTYKINKTNWLKPEKYKDQFEVTIQDGKCSVKRIDEDIGWGVFLIILAEVSCPMKEECDKMQVMFINLEKDKDRLIHITDTLSGIFGNSNIHRIEGVKHELGLEGCREAHINANIYGINQRLPYYLVSEDDVQPLVEIEDIVPYIEQSTYEKPDLVLFEQGQNLEINIKLNKVNENMFRIFGGGNNTGIYMTSRKFGLQLIQHWSQSIGKHVDHSWQELWVHNNVFFHKPQLFHQKEGESNQNDVDYRDAVKPFDWPWYEKYNKLNKNNKITK